MSITVNYHGFFDGNFGIAEATRLNVLALEKKGIQVNKINYNILEYVRENEAIPDVYINIYHININIVTDFFTNNRDLNLSGKYNILYWAWEFPEVLEEHAQILNSFDELWVPSDFCVNIFRKYTNIPIIKISHPIQILEKSSAFAQEEYNIPQNTRIFTTIFDSLSTTIRKNPEATIKAFIKASKNLPNAVLIVKTHNAEKSDKAKAILDKYADNENIIIISEFFSKEKLHSMIQQSDALISLHGSEGFGFTMAEAMAYGKIVVAIGYSGNLDFMNVNNSFLVKYDFTQTFNTNGLLNEGLTLAKPDVEDAAEKIKFIIENFDQLNTIRKKAEKEIQTHFSLENVGNILENRLDFIQNLERKNIQNLESAENIFYVAEINNLKARIAYLERTIYNKIRKKVNFFFKKLRGKD